MIELVPYQESLRQDWDELVRHSPNGHFFFERSFLDYHIDRFPSCSFLFRDSKRWLGVLPGHERGEHGWASHRGLTYGGLVLASKPRTSDVLEMFRLLNARLRNQGVREALYRPLPWFHHDQPCQASEYAMFRLGAAISSCLTTTLVPAGAPTSLSQLRKRKIGKARTDGVICGPSDDIESFWPLVEARLWERFSLKPAHNLDEIRLLMKRFPEAIEFFAAKRDGKMVSGCLTFRTRHVLHMQYLHSTDAGRDEGGADLLVDWILCHGVSPARWFCMGTSCEEDGHILNEGLLYYKESFGGHAATYCEYVWNPQEASP